MTIKRPCKIVVGVFTAIVDADGNEILVCAPTTGMTQDEVAAEVLALLNNSGATPAPPSDAIPTQIQETTP